MWFFCVPDSNLVKHSVIDTIFDLLTHTNATRSANTYILHRKKALPCVYTMYTPSADSNPRALPLYAGSVTGASEEC